jgi:CelD/BcsL family acetyltransferase involved in cellulose biosynthesis
MPVVVERLSRLSAFDDALRRAWESLPLPSPMQSFAWLRTWAESFVTRGLELSVLVVRCDDELVGIAPWYVSRTMLGARALRFLGDGLVCSDHAAVLAKPGSEATVVAALTEWLRRNVGRTWDVLHFESLDVGPSLVRDIVAQLSDSSVGTLEKQRPACWIVELPDTVEQYYAELSKNHRKRCRRWWKEYFASGRARVQVCSGDRLDEGWTELDRLNRARRDALGDRSAFLDPAFQRFHRRVLPQAATAGAAELRSLTVDGRPCALEYLLKQGTTLFCYQSGMETIADCDGVGNLSLLAMFVGAIEEGYRRVDFLRGDEDYKQHWNATRHPCTDLYLASSTLAGRADALRRRALAWARNLRDTGAVSFENKAACTP